MHRSTAEKVEVGAIPTVTALVAWLVPRAGLRFEIGELLAGAALLLLLQGFCRDLWLLRQSRRQPAAAPGREARCLCVESALGLTGIVAGIVLVGTGLAGPVVLSAVALAGGTGGTMLAGYLLKDFVFSWSPWRIFREKDHAQIIVRWRR